MLTRILVDTTAIDTNDPIIQGELEIDLKRMDRLTHKDMPEGVNAYRVTVTPSTQTYMLGFHRFRFSIQYGELNGGEFRPIGETVKYQSETLPM